MDIEIGDKIVIIGLSDPYEVIDIKNGLIVYRNKMSIGMTIAEFVIKVIRKSK